MRKPYCARLGGMSLLRRCAVLLFAMCLVCLPNIAGAWNSNILFVSYTTNQPGWTNFSWVWKRYADQMVKFSTDYNAASSIWLRLTAPAGGTAWLTVYDGIWASTPTGVTWTSYIPKEAVPRARSYYAEFLGCDGPVSTSATCVILASGMIRIEWSSFSLPHPTNPVILYSKSNQITIAENDPIWIAQQTNYVTHLYASTAFVFSASSNSFYPRSNPSNFINAATASNLFYPIGNPSGYLHAGTASNLYYPRNNPSNYTTAAFVSGNYLSLTGGTLSGSLSLSSNDLKQVKRIYENTNSFVIHLGDGLLIGDYWAFTHAPDIPGYLRTTGAYNLALGTNVPAAWTNQPSLAALSNSVAILTTGKQDLATAVAWSNALASSIATLTTGKQDLASAIAWSNAHHARLVVLETGALTKVEAAAQYATTGAHAQLRTDLNTASNSLRLSLGAIDTNSILRDASISNSLDALWAFASNSAASRWSGFAATQAVDLASNRLVGVRSITFSGQADITPLVTGRLFYSGAYSEFYLVRNTNSADVIYHTGNLNPASFQTISAYNTALTSTLWRHSGFVWPNVPTNPVGQRGQMFESNGWLYVWSDASNRWGRVQLNFAW